jgi:3-hydroxymyristoyl/3-hydroxydecanoyl-(acyl carrier protein) dehydratase
MTDALGAVELTHRVDPNLRAFDGHFAAAPVLPGAYLLALVIDAMRSHAACAARLGSGCEVQQVKFLAPVAPGDTLHIVLQPGERGVVFNVHRGGTPIARGEITGSKAASA